MQEVRVRIATEDDVVAIRDVFLEVYGDAYPYRDFTDIGLLKRSVYNAAELTWSQALDEIAAKTAITDHHPDAREGVTAFHEKRDASFNAWLEQKQ